MRRRPAPSVAAISSPHPTATCVDGESPVASANAAVIVPTDCVPAASSGSIERSIPVASRTASDHVRERGSSNASDEAFE